MFRRIQSNSVSGLYVWWVRGGGGTRLVNYIYAFISLCVISQGSHPVFLKQNSVLDVFEKGFDMVYKRKHSYMIIEFVFIINSNGYKQYFNTEYRLCLILIMFGEQGRLQGKWEDKTVWEDNLEQRVVLSVMWACSISPINSCYQYVDIYKSAPERPLMFSHHIKHVSSLQSSMYGVSLKRLFVLLVTDTGHHLTPTRGTWEGML